MRSLVLFLSLVVLGGLTFVGAPALAGDAELSELPPADDTMAAPSREVGVVTAAGPHSDDNVVVPEPATLALLGAGLVTLGVFRRRRKSKEA